MITIHEVIFLCKHAQTSDQKKFARPSVDASLSSLPSPKSQPAHPHLRQLAALPATPSARRSGWKIARTLADLHRLAAPPFALLVTDFNRPRGCAALCLRRLVADGNIIWHRR
jgi:hypothetical protein